MTATPSSEARLPKKKQCSHYGIFVNGMLFGMLYSYFARMVINAWM